MISIIMKIGENDSFSTLTDLQKEAIQSVNGSWVDSILPNTKVYLKKRLILIQVACTIEEMRYLLNTGFDTIDPDTGDTITTPLNLNWQIMVAQSETITTVMQSKLLKFFNPDPIIDPATGDITGTKKVTDIKNRLPIFAGQLWDYE